MTNQLVAYPVELLESFTRAALQGLLAGGHNVFDAPCEAVGIAKQTLDALYAYPNPPARPANVCTCPQDFSMPKANCPIHSMEPQT